MKSPWPFTLEKKCNFPCTTGKEPRVYPLCVQRMCFPVPVEMFTRYTNSCCEPQPRILCLTATPGAVIEGWPPGALAVRYLGARHLHVTIIVGMIILDLVISQYSLFINIRFVLSTFADPFFGTCSVYPFHRHLLFPFLWHWACPSISYTLPLSCVKVSEINGKIVVNFW